MSIITKDAVAPLGDDPLEFVMSDATVDRLGDTIDARGWDLKSFKRNPIALFGHDSTFMIGHWEDVRVEGGKLLGRLNLLRAGISERLDEIRAAVEAGVLRAVSVGFRSIEKEPLEKTGGIKFIRQELMECSLVTIPANPNALQVMRSLNLTDHAIKTVTGKTASGDEAMVRRPFGESAAKNFSRKSPINMSTIAQRIELSQDRLVVLQDELKNHLDTIADEPDEASNAVTEELNLKLANHQKSLDNLRDAEKRLAVVSTAVSNVEQRGSVADSNAKPFAMPAQKIAPRDYVIRAAVCKLVAHVTKQSPVEVMRERYGEDDVTKTVVDAIVTKATTVPATTTTSGWASQLIQTVNADFMDTLVPASVYPGLSSRGLRLTFGRNGVISIPSRSSTPTIAGSFVLEGSPIPVRQGAFTSTTLVPKKMAVISAFTREIAEHSTPAIEGLIRDAIQEDTSVALDTVLLDATAPSTTRPAGLRNGVSVTTATSGADFTALVTDIKNLIGALITATSGNLRAPVWIMNPLNAISIALRQNAGGDFPFAQEINAGRLQGYPVIVSPTVTSGMVFLLDASDFVSVTDDNPRFDVSDQATIHLDDTTPLAIGTAGSPNTVAAPVRSLWQTDSLALRMILPMNWTMRRASIAWTQSVTW